ncbi:hypothetical protein KAW80_01700 [Candidatus Babeliales bacterium]|nr:hypothetical protein [Candidatus Babeliales bacterium]
MSIFSGYTDIFDYGYESTYDVIYDWEATIAEDEESDGDSDLFDLEEDSDEDEEFNPELLFPGTSELGEA